jgi:hypothetical protein
MNRHNTDEVSERKHLLDPNDPHSFEPVGSILRGLWPSSLKSARSTE